jgi:hypothetical protein
MKIIPNFLSEDVLRDIRYYLNDVKKLQSKWQNSALFWPEYLTEETLSNISINSIGESISNRIIDALRPHVPYTKHIAVMHYIWNPLSSINFHNDGGSIFGATIYLNEGWNLNHGGFLLVEEDNGIKAYPPVFNTCIINTDVQNHAVSMTSAFAPKRHTIQIFGKNEV